MSLCYENVGAYLVEAVPEFKPILDKHIEEYGELLPHVLFGELTLWTIDLFRRWQQTRDESVCEVFNRVKQFIESCINAEDDRVQELAMFSFLENLWQAGEDYPSIQQHLGAKIQFWLDKIEEWWRHSREVQK
jgi:hypothetical protein